MKQLLVFMAVIAATFLMTTVSPVAAKVMAQPVEYAANGVVLKGFLAYDNRIKGPRPGVLVVHEWWGHNQYARNRATMLAKQGYTALAVDMYGEGRQAAHPEDAGKFSSELMKNFDVATTRFLAARDFLKQEPTVDPAKIAAIGYCFGGGIVLNMARQGIDLKGVASFHGSLALMPPAQPGGIKARILVLHGEDDKFVTAEQIEAFKKELKEAGADLTFIAYPGARHGFTNPDADEYAKRFNMQLGYHAEADLKSWAELTSFLMEIFK